MPKEGNNRVMLGIDSHCRELNEGTLAAKKVCLYLGKLQGKKSENFVSKSLIFEKNVKGTIHDDFSIIEGF